MQKITSWWRLDIIGNIFWHRANASWLVNNWFKLYVSDSFELIIGTSNFSTHLRYNHQNNLIPLISKISRVLTNFSHPLASFSISMYASFCLSSSIKLFHDRGPYHIETSSLICSVNQSTGFYMIGTSVIKELSSWDVTRLTYKYSKKCFKKKFFIDYISAIVDKVEYPQTFPRLNCKISTGIRNTSEEIASAHYIWAAEEAYLAPRQTSIM